MNNTTATEEIDSYSSLCDNFAAMWYINTGTYLSFLFGLPLHILIISRLYLSVSKLRKYHLLIILQSINEIVKVSFSVIYITSCAVFKVFLIDYASNVTDVVRLILTVVLMIYWKKVIRPQPLLDISLFVLAFISLCSIIVEAELVKQAIPESPNLFILTIIVSSIVAEILLAVICILTFVLVMKLDVSTFSEVTIKGQKRLATVLFLQLLFVLIMNALDVFSSSVDYYLLSAPFLTEALEKIAKETDMAVKNQIAQEVKARYQSILAASSLVMTSTAWLEKAVPIVRGLLMYWVIKPLLKKKEVVFVSRSTMGSQSTSGK